MSKYKKQARISMRKPAYNPLMQDFILEWLEPYNNHLELKGCKEASIKMFQRKIEMLLDFFELDTHTQVKIQDFNANHVNLFLNGVRKNILKKKITNPPTTKRRKSAIQAENMSHWTYKTYITALKSFFYFISDNNDYHLDFSNVFKKVITIKTNTAVERFNSLERKKIHLCLQRETAEVLQRKKKSKIGAMFAINILFYTGLRASEVLSISTKDFRGYDNQFYSIEVQGKGGSIRKTFIQRELADKFLPLLPEGKIYNVGYRAFYDRVNRFLAKSGIDYQKSGCHIFRHSFGDSLVDNGVDLKIIQELLGHKKISTTAEFYTRASDDTKTKTLAKVFLEAKAPCVNVQ